jgi:hypothetical protein
MGVTSVLNSSIGRITLSRHRAHTDLCHEAPVAEDIVLEGDLLRHLLRASGEERAARPAPRLELPRVIADQLRSRPMRFIIAA